MTRQRKKIIITFIIVGCLIFAGAIALYIKSASDQEAEKAAQYTEPSENTALKNGMALVLDDWTVPKDDTKAHKSKRNDSILADVKKGDTTYYLLKINYINTRSNYTNSACYLAKTSEYKNKFKFERLSAFFTLSSEEETDKPSSGMCFTHEIKDGDVTLYYGCGKAKKGEIVNIDKTPLNISSDGFFGFIDTKKHDLSYLE